MLTAGSSREAGGDTHLGVSIGDRRDSLQLPPLSLMPVESCTPATESRAIEVQGILARQGRHRALPVPDLLVASLAELAGLTVLHVDKDFELIADVTGQPVQRLEHRG